MWFRVRHLYWTYVWGFVIFLSSKKQNAISNAFVSYTRMCLHADWQMVEIYRRTSFAMANDKKSKSHANHAPHMHNKQKWNGRNPFVFCFLFVYFRYNHPRSLSVCVWCLCLYLWLEQTHWCEMQMCTRTRTLSLSSSESSLCAYHF